MIVPELQLQQLFATIPTYEIETGRNALALTYNFGDHKTLLAFLRQRRGKNVPLYPLLWLIMPFREEHFDTDVRGTDFTLILAVNTRKDWFNPQRYNETFRTYLLPYLNLVRQALTKANNITLQALAVQDGHNVFLRVVKYPNYGDPEDSAGGDRNQATDYWDAIQITFKARFTQNCLLTPIIYNTQNLTTWQY